MNNESLGVSTMVSRILCVDDDFDSRELIRFILSKEDESLNVTTASTMDEAMGLIDIQPFDLYILDYCLPLKSGIQLCRRIRETDRQTPVLFYSAMGRRIDREVAAKAGADGYLVKPNDFENLFAKVCELLGKFAPNRQDSIQKG